jgi:arsenate reductase
MTSKSLILYHNPNCSTSRKVLGMLHDAGRDPQVVDYLKVGWTRAVLDDLLKQMQAEPSDILRAKDPLAKELGLTQSDVSGEAVLQAMIEHPVLVERPIVVSPKGAAVCRPAETVNGLI